MATRQDVDLARRLLQAGVLSEDQLRGAMELQGQWAASGNNVPLEQVLYSRGDLPEGSLVPLSAPPPSESQPFTNYRLSSELGVGGLATVYGAIYKPNDTPVAVKVLEPVHALRKMQLDRFHHEARLHNELEHDNIVSGYEYGVEGGYHFYSMDLVDGATVLEVIERRGHLTNEEALSVTLQAAYALECLHEHGLIHRDIKPGNIMVESSGWARLIDLGLVGELRADGADPVPNASTTVGTVEYLSPEQARGRGDLDARADLYSLGMALYHMVVGEVAFDGDNDYEVMAKQILTSMDAQKIKTRRIEPEVYFLIAKMSAKDRDERLDSAAEVADIIEGYLPSGVVELDLGEAPPPTEPPQPAPEKSVRPAPQRGTGRGSGRSTGRKRPRRRRFR